MEAPTCQPVEKQMISLQGVLVVRIQAIRPCGRGPRNSAGRQEGTNVCDTRRCRREMEAGERSKRPPGLPCKSHFDGSAQRLRYGCDGIGRLIGRLAMAGPMGEGITGRQQRRYQRQSSHAQAIAPRAPKAHACGRKACHAACRLQADHRWRNARQQGRRTDVRDARRPRSDRRKRCRMLPRTSRSQAAGTPAPYGS